MGGEWSKRIGEEGEAKVKGLLDLLGWAPLITNYDIPCSFPTEHSTGESKTHRREHGLDVSVRPRTASGDCHRYQIIYEYDIYDRDE